MLYALIGGLIFIVAALYLKKERIELQRCQNNAVSAYNQLEIHKKLRTAKENYRADESENCYDNMVILSTRIYNETAEYYNKRCRQLPSCIAAAALGFHQLKLVEEKQHCTVTPIPRRTLVN